MCGIYAAIGDNSSTKLTLTKLKALEYRGYDSWGVAWLKSHKFSLAKEIGQINLQKNSLPEEKTLISLGHTRWATHGGVTAANSHPHFNEDQTLVAVHNGIIENYQSLQKKLEASHTFTSETDSEVFIHLVEELLLEFNFVEAVRRAFLQVKGYSAFVIANSQTQEVIAIKKGSPLILGIDKGTNNSIYLASDSSVILEDTNHLLFLEDNQMAIINNGNLTLRNAKNSKKIKPNIQKVERRVENTSKKDFEFYLEKEIFDQSEALQRINLEFKQQIENIAGQIKQAEQVYLVGCGTAYHAALTSSYLLAQVAGIKTTAVVGSEFSYHLQFCNDQTLVIFFSQSGETIDIVKPLKDLKKQGIKTFGIVNTFGSSLYRLADDKIWLKAGPEKSVLSTKAFTAKVALMMLVSFNLIKKERSAHKKLSQTITNIQNVLKPSYQQRYLDPLVDRLADQKNLFGIGRGLSFPLILEGALKIKEVTYKHMEGFAGGELKHGVIALIEPGTPCFVLAPNDQEQDLILSGAMEIKSRGGLIIGLAPKNNEIFDHWLKIPDKDGIFSGLVSTVVMQLIAYKLARKLELDPDKPRNLAKSVTVI